MRWCRTLSMVETHAEGKAGRNPSSLFPKSFQLSDCWGEAADLLL